jgi:excisionase family DNA binding protein
LVGQFKTGLLGSGGASSEARDEKMKKRMKVTLETNRLLVIARRGQAQPCWCTHCGAQVQMLWPDEAAALTGVSARTIYALVEAGQLHFTETADGRLLICPNSLRC